ncbi:DUF2064 domain-containing protein [Rhodococcus sp. USK13]|uniref:TIGR04282 family arsenosugar biosynthesis glycosyltransferase n=1 Tax=Rhodococcus sp. USK13 TaxID=2806442 RepID=UPI001BCCD1A9|nr:DUF2064 domain-containing protein [Rhodococcus sp. USK13]
MSVGVAVLVVAKAPVPGFAKTRLAREIGNAAAADLAAASLLDTLDAVTSTEVTHRVVALTGDLARATRSREIKAALKGVTVLEQRGGSFAERLVNAHADTFTMTNSPVLQIGMDTPQVTAHLLTDAAALLADETPTCVLGPAEDGGWWALGVPDPGVAEVILPVPTSSSETGRKTYEALIAAGASVRLLPTLRDVDHAADLGPVAAQCALGSRFRTCEYLLTFRG